MTGLSEHLERLHDRRDVAVAVDRDPPFRLVGVEPGRHGAPHEQVRGVGIDDLVLYATTTIRPSRLPPRNRAPTVRRAASPSHPPSRHSWLQSPIRVTSEMTAQTCSGVASARRLHPSFVHQSSHDRCFSVVVVLVEMAVVRWRSLTPGRASSRPGSRARPGRGSVGSAGSRARSYARTPRAIWRPRWTGPCADATSSSGSLDVVATCAAKRAGSTNSSHGVFWRVEDGEALVVQVGRHVGRLVHLALVERPERVDRPEHAGGRVEQAARSRGSRTSAGARGAACGRRRRARRPDRANASARAGARRRRTRRATIEKLATSVAFGQRSSTDVEVADVVVVVVRDEDPADVGRIDDRERLVQPLVAHERTAGVDDDGLLAADDERVRAEERSRRFGGERRDQPGVGGDGVGGGVERDSGSWFHSFGLMLSLLIRVRLY